MNKLGFGLLRLPQKDGTVDWDLVDQLVDVYMKNGGDYFDTCYTYLNGMSEESLRRCIVQRKPRESFRIAEKIPGYKCESREDCAKYFEEERQRCGVETFDVLMLHWLNGKNYETAEKFGQFEFLSQKKKEGQAVRIGFSYHDSAALQDTILTRHPEVDVVQLQINYLDWDSAGIESRKCYEVCVRHQKPVIVMEPVKGGTLARIPEEAETILKAVHPDWTPSDWALRFVQSLPGVEICLSGMNAMDQVIANTADFQPLTQDEVRTLLSIVPIINGKTAVPCTGCRYCVEHCVKNIPIPDYFKMYNEIIRSPQDDWKIKPSYAQLSATHGKASDCIACRNCQRHCPQKISIPDLLKDAARLLEQ